MMSVGGGVLGGSCDMLRLYGSLTADQKQALQSDNGLPFSQLTDKQWDQINKIITDRFGGLYVTDGKVKMDHSEATIAAGVRSFAITIQVNGEEKPREMTQTVMVPGKDQIAQMRKMRQQTQDKAKAAGQTKDAKPADPDAPK
jgi:hypothetical protein